MSNVAQLVFTYFARMPALRWVSLGGVLALILGVVVLPLVGFNDITSIIGFLGGVVLVPAAALMPLTVGRMARTSMICVLPYGRLKLFLSALSTVLIVSIPLPLLAVMGQFATWPADVAHFSLGQAFSTALYLFSTFYVSTFLLVTWLYIAVWFATSERNGNGLAKCMLIVIAIVWLPKDRIRDLDPKFHLTLLECVLTWAALGLWLAYASRLRGREPLGWMRILPGRTGASYASGREFDVMLGTAQPWLYTLGVLSPLAIQTLVGFELTNAWLFYFTLASTSLGALAGYAAERTRSAWLRARWSREELFTHVERAFWRHNSILVALFVALLIALTPLYALPVRVVLLGVPLIVLGMVLSMYLGLMLTRGLRWPETTLGVIIMLAVMGTAVLASGNARYTSLVIGLEIVFAIIAIVLRLAAQGRWHELDWMLCRAERPQN